MKRLYWRPRQVSQAVIVFLAAFSLMGLASVEYFKIKSPQSDLEEKFQASKLSAKMMETIKIEKLNRAIPINRESDPAESGMMGTLMSPITTLTGRLTAKQTSVNPNYAAVLVEMLIEAGVEAGDIVAVGYSGSFPAMNVHLCAALTTLKARPIIIASGGSSQWGANDPSFMWIDMEHLLHEEGLMPFHSVACSIGGYEDIGLGMSREARDMVEAAIRRNDLKLLRAGDFTSAINERMMIYDQNAGTEPIKAYINVGGGTISVGRGVGKRAYKPGLNSSASRATLEIDSIMTRFMRKGVPVIHVIEIDSFARRFGLPLAPQQMPTPGDGGIYNQTQYNKLWTFLVLVAIIVSLRAFVLTDFGHRFVKGRGPRKAAGQPEPMV